MTTQAQKDEEVRALDLLIEKLGLDVVTKPKRDPPAADFKVTLADGTVLAIEHTDARDEHLAAVTDIVERFKSHVRQHLAKRGANVWVRPRFDEYAAAALRKQKKVLEREATLLADLAADDLPHLTAGAFIEHKAAELKARGILYVLDAQVQLHHKPLATWVTRSRGQREKVIQKAIDRKAGKLAQYRAHAPAGAQVWLMVAAGSGGHGASVDTMEAIDGTFTSPFDRTFFVNLYPFEQRVVELATSP
jgi:hypothetical protein